MICVTSGRDAADSMMNLCPRGRMLSTHISVYHYVAIVVCPMLSKGIDLVRDRLHLSLWPYQYGPRVARADKAWERGAQGEGVVVAILDTGVDVNHPDLRGSLWTNEAELNGGFPGVDDDGNGKKTTCIIIILFIIRISWLLVQFICL